MASEKISGKYKWYSIMAVFWHILTQTKKVGKACQSIAIL